jgi:ribosomal protein L24E
MSYGTVMLCGHCGRPIIPGVGMSVIGGDGRTYHYECARSPYATNEKAFKEKNNGSDVG